MTKYFVLTFILLTPSWVMAAACGGSPAIYYVDFGVADDSGAGTRVSPWKHAPGDTGGTWGNSNCTLQAGDIIIFKGNVQYDGTIVITWSGSGMNWTDTNPIIYDGDSGTYATRWASGTAKAIIDGGGTRTSGFLFDAARNHVKINSFEIRNGNEAADDTRLIYAPNASTYVEISNNTIHDSGILTVSPWKNYGDGIRTYGSYWRIHDNSIYDCYSVGIQAINGANNIDIYSNAFTDKLGWAIGISSSTDKDISNINIYNNTFIDIYYISTACAGVNVHGNNIFAYTNAGGGSYSITELRIYNNTFANTVDLTTNYYSTAFLHIEGYDGYGPFDGVYIYNNEFFNGPAYYDITIYDGNMSNIFIYNNSSWSPSAREVSWLQLTGAQGGVDIASIKNNSISGGGPSIYMNGTITNLAIDYNNHNTPNASVGKVGANFYDWAGWKGLGHDTHSPNSQTSDPLYASVTLGSFNLAIPVYSPAKWAGTATGQLSVMDKLGITWHSPPSIGAYEYYEQGSIRGVTSMGVSRQ